MRSQALNIAMQTLMEKHSHLDMTIAAVALCRQIIETELDVKFNKEADYLVLCSTIDEILTQAKTHPDWHRDEFIGRGFKP